MMKVTTCSVLRREFLGVQVGPTSTIRLAIGMLGVRGVAKLETAQLPSAVSLTYEIALECQRGHVVAVPEAGRPAWMASAPSMRHLTIGPATVAPKADFGWNGITTATATVG